MLAWCTHKHAADKRRNTPMRILCVELAKCSPIIRWWCSGFCSLWLIISSFQSRRKQLINFIQVLIQLLRCNMRKVSRGGVLVLLKSKVKNEKGKFQDCKRARRQFANPLIITPCCLSHFALNLPLTSVMEHLKNKLRQRGVMHSTEIHPVKWHAVRENSDLVFWS